MKINSVEINGLVVYTFESTNQLLEYIEDKKQILVAINSKKIKSATDSTRLLTNTNIGYIDGAGALLAVKHKGIKNAAKIPGCELWLEIIKEYYLRRTFYFIGAQEPVLKATVDKLKIEYPEIKILGYRDGYIKDQLEKEKLIDDISEKRPDIVFVAMGSPQQELLMMELYNNHRALYQGLGGSFDVYTGKVKRAPRWFITHNLEGVYRACNEPKKRILGVLSDIVFLFQLKRGKY